MFRKLILLPLLLTGGCMADRSDPVAPATADAGPQMPPPDMPPPPPPGNVDVASRKAQLKGKDGTRLARDLAQALELPRAELCRELGAYDCVDDAHRIVLGGVEPYVLRVDQPLPITPVTGPIAVDRLALSACGARASRDFSGAPIVFGPLVEEEAGGRAAVVRALYDRLLGRPPDAHELVIFDELAGEVTDARDYATLACFMVATSSEFIFY